LRTKQQTKKLTNSIRRQSTSDRHMPQKINKIQTSAPSALNTKHIIRDNVPHFTRCFIPSGKTLWNRRTPDIISTSGNI